MYASNEKAEKNKNRKTLRSTLRTNKSDAAVVADRAGETARVDM